jgi:hypothetical protein
MEEAFKKMKIEKKHFSKEELEKEIIDYLSERPPARSLHFSFKTL